MKKIKFIVAIIVFQSFLSSPIFAEDKEYNPLDKFGRGATNVTLGLGEIPIQVMRETEESNIFYGMTTGLAVGFGRTVLRTAVGVYELGTFLIPYPLNYAPIMKPEHVFLDSQEEIEMELEE